MSSQPSQASAVVRNIYSQRSEGGNTQNTASQQSQQGGGTQASTEDGAAVGGRQVVDYDREKEIFEKFLREHTIVINENTSSSDIDDDDDIMWEPVPVEEFGVRRRRIVAYADFLQRIVNRDFDDENSRVFLLEVPLQELADFGEEELAKRASENTLRYEEVFSQVVDSVLENMAPTRTNRGDQDPSIPPDSVELLYQHRLTQQRNQEQARQEAQAASEHNHFAGSANVEDDDDNNANPARNPTTGATQEFPPLLLRRYELRILPLLRRGSLAPFDKQHIPQPKEPTAVSLRQIRSHHMGRLVTLTGMIVRASDVKPCTLVATYSCDRCGSEIYQPTPYQREFMPPKACPSAFCQQASKGQYTLQLQTRGSKFVKFQEIKLQELPSQVPMGHVPRSLSVHCRGELTRLAAPGDVITIDGIYLPQRLAESGFKAMKAGLVSTTYLHAQNIFVHKKSYDDNDLWQDANLSPQERNELQEAIDTVAQSEDPVGRLSSSLAPEIFGHEDIKRALLLQLVGGVTRALPDGMRIRGDLNLCLMGDPGVAKSQLLKHVASIAPRGVYTTGKGSSGVGLTAAVTKDMATGEMALEGGALVLADQGICCIDEFDKMDEADRTAIHEVMEQQQVSIAKAGIVATLNARAAVLAAANPLYGRYNRHKSLSDNVNLPNSLLSRFDLLFLVLDIANVDRDMALARHVTLVHQNEGLDKNATLQNDEDDDSEDEFGENQNRTSGEDENDENAPLPPRVLREYICRARKHQPVVPPEVAPYIVEAYVSLRLQEKRSTNDQTAMTARQLLSILRLSQALARLRFSDLVARQDVDEAIRLTHMSKASLEDPTGSGGKDGATREDITSRIFQVLREYLAASGNDQEIDLRTAEAMVLRKGFTAQHFQTCLEEYEALRVIQINQTRTHIYFL